MKIKGATLLSIEEYNELRDNIPVVDYWWLRSPGGHYNRVARVCKDGNVDEFGGDAGAFFGVRPALKISGIKSSGFKIGDKFMFGRHVYTIISESYALCDTIIGDYQFRKAWNAKDANVYEKSDVKALVDRLYVTYKGADSEIEPVYMLHITDIGLATVKDVKECYEFIPRAMNRWWICNENRSAMVANWDVGGYKTDIETPGDITYGLENKFIGIRPKLTLLKEDGENFEIGEEVDFLGKRWTFIRKNEIICNEIIARGPWGNPNPYCLIEEDRSEADSAYDTSTLKTFLEEWLKNR